MTERVCDFCGNPSDMVYEASSCCMKCFYKKIGREYPMEEKE